MSFLFEKFTFLYVRKTLAIFTLQKTFILYEFDIPPTPCDDDGCVDVKTEDFSYLW